MHLKSEHAHLESGGAELFSSLVSVVKYSRSGRKEKKDSHVCVRRMKKKRRERTKKETNERENNVK